MPLTDPIGDMLTRMRNAQHARHEQCTFGWSKIKLEICELMKREGYLSEVETTGEKPKEMITVTFVPGRKLTVKRESAPGRRRYIGMAKTKPVLSGFGTAILSTSSGIVTDSEAREKKIGGELLCTVS